MLVQYNGVLLPFVSTDRCEWEPVYQDGDFIYTRVTVQVTTVLTPDLPGFVLEGETPREAFNRVRHELEEPRRRLTLLAGPQPDYALPRAAFPDPSALLDVGPADDPLTTAPSVVNPSPNRDLANGPLPTPVRVIQTTGADCWIIQWGVVACVRLCHGQDVATLPKFLSCRWEESATIDDEFLTTRTRTGTLRIRPDVPLDPDGFRWVVCPPIPDGFTRKESVYKRTADGLALQFTFVDVETPTMPPAPAVKAEGSFRAVSHKGAIFTAECNVRLSGDPRGSKKRLVATAFAVALERLRKAGPANRDFRGVPLQCMIEEDLYRNRCQVSLKCQLPPSKKAVYRSGTAQNAIPPLLLSPSGTGSFLLLWDQLFQRRNKSPSLTPPAATGPADNPDVDVPKVFDLGGFGFGQKPLFSKETRGPDPGLRSTAGLRLAACVLNDPCLTRSVNQLNGYGVGPNRRDPSAGGDRELRTAPSAGENELRGEPRGRSRVGDRAVVLDPNDLPPDYPDDGTVPAVAVIEEVAVLPDPVNTADRQAGGAYASYTITVVYDSPENRIGVTEMAPPVAAVGTPGETGYQPARGVTRYIPLSAPSMGCTVEWSAERAGEPPQIPPYTVSDPNVVPLGVTVNPGPVETDDTGVTLVYRASGRYRYGFRSLLGATIGLYLPPWLNELMFGPTYAHTGGQSGPLVFGPLALPFPPAYPPPPQPPPPPPPGP